MWRGSPRGLHDSPPSKISPLLGVFWGFGFLKGSRFEAIEGNGDGTYCLT